MRRTCFPRVALLFSMTAFLAACGSSGTGGGSTAPVPSADRQLSFGVDMARRELWSEALFRFHQAEAQDPNNPRIHNNLAVAYEATGDFENALKHYQQALRLDPNNRDLRANWTRFSQFYSAFTQQRRAQAGQPGRPAQPGAAATPPAAGTADPAASPPPTPPTPPTIGQPAGSPSPTPQLAPPQTAPAQPPVDAQPDQNPPPPPPPTSGSNPGASPTAAALSSPPAFR
jgi:hypothetical protein